MAKPKRIVSIHSELHYMAEKMYLDELRELFIKNEIVNEVNGISKKSLIFFPLIVNYFESWFNVRFLSRVSFGLRHELAELDPSLQEEIVNLNFKIKLLLCDKILHLNKVDFSRQPFQDLESVIKIRNGIVHFKFQEAPEGIVTQLSQRKYTADGIFGKDYKIDWIQNICTLECMRWGYNTIIESMMDLDLHFKSPIITKELILNLFESNFLFKYR